LVTVATPSGCQAVVAAMGPEYMTEALDEADPDESAAGRAAERRPAGKRQA